MNREKIACSCRRITYGMIEEAVNSGAKNYEEAQKLLGFGRGCGRCIEFIGHKDSQPALCPNR